MSLVQVAAEREAWDASKKHKFELVTICPTFVLGPVISNRADATSILDVKVHDSAMLVAILCDMHAALEPESIPTAIGVPCTKKLCSHNKKVKDPMLEMSCSQSWHLHRTIERLVWLCRG